MSSNETDQLLVRFISAVDLFKHIDPDDVVALLRQSARLDFESGEQVFVEGDQGYSMYVVTQGAFEVYRTVSAQHIHIANVEPGEHFGEIALLINRPRSASIRAIKPSSAIRFSKQAIMAEHRAAALLFRNMAELMAQRLISADEEVILHKTGKYPLFHPSPEPTQIKQHEYVIVKRS
ncbi:MAG: cyclic nucleotide-binding domain-containing protein [Gallionellaceae bacterium]|nr:cyclic nucleotide-binding domain-containing protein [Gallionellaceae bacterium]